MSEVQQENINRTVLTSENAAAFYAKKLDLEVKPPEPEEPAKPVEPVEAATEEPDEPAEEIKEEDKEEPKKEPSKVAKRFSEITAQRKAAEARAAEAEAKAAAAEARAKQLEQKLTPKEEVKTGEPKPEDFKDAFEYAKALAKYEAKTEIEAARREEQKKALEQQNANRLKNWQERAEHYGKQHEDFAPALQEVMLTPIMKQVIIDSDLGPEVLHYLHQNHEEVERIRNLNDGDSIKALGRLEGRLEAKPVVKETKVAELSKAPAPITPLDGGKTPPEVPVNRAGEFTGDYQQWKALRKAGKIH